MMKGKTIVMLLLLLSSLLPLFAAGGEQIWLTPQPGATMFNLNLASEVHYGLDKGATHTDTGVKSRTSYTNNEIIAYAGVAGYANGATVTFNFGNSKPWYYVSQSEPEYFRPFGIILVTRAATSYNSSDGRFTGHKTIAIQYVGRQSGHTGNALESATVNLPATDGATTEGNYYASWVDVVLVLDPWTDPGTGYVKKNNTEGSAVIPDATNPLYGRLATGKYDYYTTFSMKVSATGSDGKEDSLSSAFVLNGFFDGSTTAGENTSSVVLHAVPTADATTLQINTGASVTVGTYQFVGSEQLTAYTSDPTAGLAQAQHNYRIFASPYDDLTTQTTDGYFELRMEGTENLKASRYNSIRYTVTLTDKEDKEDSKVSEVMFQGNEVYADPAEGMAARKTFVANAQQFKSYVNYELSGDIKINIPQEGSYGQEWGVGNLVSGTYSSKIYIHVVSQM